MDKKSTVTKSNALVEASYRLSVYEQRILLSCISQAKKGADITDAIIYEIRAADVAKITGADVSSTYRELHKAAYKLKRREITLYSQPNGKGEYNAGRTIEWVQLVGYKKKEGIVEVRFSKDILPYLSMLTEQFTKYALGDVARMSSAYAIRMYELFVQWDSVGEREVSVEWLRKILQTEDKYPLIRDFKKWVIQPAIKQVNELSPMWVEWSQKKNGRTITHFVFKFGIRDSKLPSKKPPKQPEKGYWYGISKEVLDKRANPGESYEECALRLLEEAKKG